MSETASDSRFGAAFSLAMAAHQDQKDKSGQPYMGHVLRVAARVADNPLAIVVALLHDVVEDSSHTVEYVRGEFGDVIADAVDALTHREDESRNDYLSRVASNALATRVKLADLDDNSDESRLALVQPAAERDRLRDKYATSRHLLGRLAKATGETGHDATG